MADKMKNLFQKEISLQKGKLPTKRHINLVIDEEHKNDKTAIAFFIIFLLCLGVFVKLFVINRLEEVNVLANQYSQLSNQLNALKTKTADYNEIKAQYDLVTDWYLTENEKTEVDKNDVFAMIDQDVTPYIVIKAVSVSGNVITVQTGEATLTQVATCVSILQNDSRNSYVTATTVNAANNDEQNNNVTATIAITYAGRHVTEGSEE